MRYKRTAAGKIDESNHDLAFAFGIGAVQGGTKFAYVSFKLSMRGS